VGVAIAVVLLETGGAANQAHPARLMMRGSRIPEGLLATAQRALAVNRLYGLTVPHLEMFQAAYLWDVAVITKGISVLDPERAAGDIVRYLQSQWRSGMLPNEAYFEDRPVRRRMYGRHPDSPEGLTTSGITQPPMIVRSALEVGRRLGPSRRSSFYRSVFPQLKHLCRWVLEERVGKNGLAVQIHPYETGMDNRIDLAEAMETEWRTGSDLVHRSARRAALAAVSAARRLWGDCRTVPIGHRSSSGDVLAAYLQTRHIRHLGYDFAAIEASGRGLLVEDVGYNSVLVDAFCCLQELADELGRQDGPGFAIEADMKAAMNRVANRLEDLWCDDPQGRGGGYFTRNYRTGEFSRRPTVAGIFPLLVGRIKDRTRELTKALVDPSKYWTLVAPPSAPIDSEGFAPNEYWRGAAWSFPTDIIETALEVQGDHEIASSLRQKYLRRPLGMHHAEYENPMTGHPLGARPFSPAAALAVRLANKEGL
jgi:hypothetical protein